MQGRYGLEDDLPFLPLAMFDGERSSLEMTVAEETQQSGAPFVPVMCSLEREAGQSAVEFADKIKESLCR